MHKYIWVKLNIGVHKYMQWTMALFEGEVVTGTIADVTVTTNVV